MAVSAYDFTSSIAINTHMAYTDGAYANVANVASDLAYLGISTIRDSVPNPNGGVPAANQIAALQTLAADGIKFDLLVSPYISIAQSIQQITTIEQSDPGSIIAVEGPNEINNNPVAYNGLAGQAAAVAFQTALYAAMKSSAATSNIGVYNFTGGVTSPLTVAGMMTQNANGSYTLVNGQTGFPVTLPAGLSTIKVTYTGNGSAGSGLFAAPGQGQVTSITYGTNGVITYTYDNTSSGPQGLYVDIADWGSTVTLTGVSVTGPASAANLVTFDPSLSLAGEADYANIHPYAYGNSAIDPLIASNYAAAFGSATPGPRVITETGYTTDPDAANGVSELVQAQQIVNGLFDAYQSGVSTTYIYELLDEKSDPSDANSQMHYGVFNSDNTPKMAATALHDLTTILADNGAGAASFQPGTLGYTETGGTSSDHALLLEKSNGVFDLALWNDAGPGTTASDQLTISFGQTYQNITVYDVVTDARTDYRNISQLNVQVGGDAMIVEIDPNPAVALTGIATSIIASLLNQAASMNFLSAGDSGGSSPAAGTVTIADMISGLQPVMTTPTLSAAKFGGVQNGIFTHTTQVSPMSVVAAMISKLRG